MPAVPATELTVAALAERFMRVHVEVNCKPRAIDTYRGVLELHIVPALGGMALSAVGRREIAALHHGLRDKPCTANAAVRVASSMFQRAEAWELVPPGRNPCRSVRRYNQHSRERFLTPEEYRCLGRALSEAEADGSVWPPAIAAIRLLMLTGCRHSEILTLRWDDVDRTAGELRLRDAKTGSRMVPMTAPVAAVLDGIEREPGNPWVIVRKTPGARMANVTLYCYCIRAQAGLDDLRLHDCRHSFASHAVMNGVPVPVVPRLFGHSDVRMTLRYAHLADSDSTDLIHRGQ